MRALIAGIVGIGFLAFGLLVGTHDPVIGATTSVTHSDSSTWEYSQLQCGPALGKYPADGYHTKGYATSRGQELEPGSDVPPKDFHGGSEPGTHVSPCVQRRDQAWLIAVASFVLSGVLLLLALAELMRLVFEVFWPSPSPIVAETDGSYDDESDDLE